MTSAHYSSSAERSAAQAVKLVRALCDQLHEMTRELARLERQGVTATSRRASAIRQATAALRRDINEAQILIDRLQRRYVNGNKCTQQRPPRRHPEPRQAGAPSNLARHRPSGARNRIAPIPRLNS